MQADTTPTDDKTLLVTLPQYCLVTITGQDASKFLQGQVTCDLRELNSSFTRLGAQCNPKGRMIFSFSALQTPAGAIHLRIPKAMQVTAVQSLNKYIVFSKANVEAAEEQYQLYGLIGLSALKAASKFFASLPVEVNQWVTQDKSFLIKLSDERFECWIHRDNNEEFLNNLSAVTQQSPTHNWTLQDIRAGISHILPATKELFTPQELNYQLINAISFRKGCYTGQEIIARLHYKGKLKRHTHRFTLTNAELPAVATPIVTAQGNTCGLTLEAAYTSTSNIELLASIQSEHLNTAFLFGSTEKLQPLELPYAIPTTDDVSH
jgi:tRNA-modifying protein YgfZ